VTSIGGSAFYSCRVLTVAVFLGDAPSLGSSVFGNTAPGFTIHYLSRNTGFTSPTWNGYPSVMLDAVPSASETWLLGHGYPLDTDLHQDLNGDGVSLLMAYALDLDPNLNLRSSLPQPVLDTGTLSISFYAASGGITYTVESSIALGIWTTEGVTVSPLDIDGRSTASVGLDSPSKFLRLVVDD
jgi:hypothetical protein